MGPSMRRKRSARACRGKLRLTMEEAADRYRRYPDKDTGIYLCACGWLHFGHTPKWLKGTK